MNQNYIIYIKENNVWEKDDDQKSNLIKAIKKAATKAKAATNSAVKKTASKKPTKKSK